MANEQTIGFKISKVVTEQFAIIEESFNEQEEIDVDANLRFALSRKNKAVGVFGLFKFEQKKIPFLQVEISCHFNIAEDSWNSAQDEEGNLVFPKGFMQHLGMITVGTTRGVLHAKTESTRFNNYVLPTIDVAKMINRNVTFSKKKETK